ncbi:hypothetical protein CC85DRAFT_285849 [Cutaneotrichosporon oleaginosum]|uniref:Sld7 C-terminal domain-containing protein n=1 Tax=Cutaneotrichosporon oleaginosum TaxID=879819 RepID=A0A0J0XLV1_9TREE|nr:uncharacterized protein CC85DRAFT_285849 [Cutaneotrichosporon oleaginosum]KLT42077.1 hypothetical protein CC85DRAFT_285849 [Cutaneotrichosporon oleaginosum]TXT04684.1 hypothetical protein COLE_07503 [Cutaneotrichosporon oleaginosum]
MPALSPTRLCEPPSMAANPFARPLPSPSKRNPFARATEATSFTRKGLLPAASPKQTQTKSQWRMLWRGGFEIGPDGWRLDGVTFFALLSFPTNLPTPSDNPFAPPTPGPSDPALPSDADLCLSLESLRGRKYLAVRGSTELTDEEALDGEEIQMSTTSPLLAAFLTGMLCREPSLSLSGRTRTAIIVGLGDGADENVLIYGQRVAETQTLKLCVGRKKPPPPPEKVRPGQPLPRAPPLLEVRRGLPFSRRAISRSSVHVHVAAPPLRASLPISGRLGEKRSRVEENPRRRASLVGSEADSDVFGSTLHSRAPSVRRETSRAPSAVPSTSACDDRLNKRARVLDSQQVVDNKGCIRKLTMHMLEERGHPRDGDIHKEVWPVAYKGAYFALVSQV